MISPFSFELFFDKTQLNIQDFFKGAISGSQKTVIKCTVPFTYLTLPPL
jgi:hypothetical protein